MQEHGAELLDNPEALKAADPAGMLSELCQFGHQLVEAQRSAARFELDPTHFTQPRQIVFCGMGGSAIGGDFL